MQSRVISCMSWLCPALYIRDVCCTLGFCAVRPSCVTVKYSKSGQFAVRHGWLLVVRPTDFGVFGLFAVRQGCVFYVMVVCCGFSVVCCTSGLCALSRDVCCNPGLCAICQSCGLYFRVAGFTPGLCAARQDFVLYVKVLCCSLGLCDEPQGCVL